MELLRKQTWLVLCLPSENQQLPPACYAGTWAAASVSLQTGERESEEAGICRRQVVKTNTALDQALARADNPSLCLGEIQPYELMLGNLQTQYPPFN